MAGSETAAESTYFFDLANQSVSLLLFVGLIVFLAGGKIKESLKTRAENLAQEIETAQNAHDVAKKALDEYESLINSFEAERESLLATYRTQGEEEKAKLIAEGKAEAERVAKDAQRAAENELASMQQRIERELIDLSLARAEEMITSKLAITDHTRLTQNYLSELDKAARK
ncbi:MAG: hypothetical protein CMH49_01215 [Myxococcales bacterium]|nr:hypothetical protein [Myxococcales bacterium]